MAELCTIICMNFWNVVMVQTEMLEKCKSAQKHYITVPCACSNHAM